MGGGGERERDGTLSKIQAMFVPRSLLSITMIEASDDIDFDYIHLQITTLFSEEKGKREIPNGTKIAVKNRNMAGEKVGGRGYMTESLVATRLWALM